MVAIEPMKSALENEGTETCARTGCARQSLTARPKKSAGPSSSRRPTMRWPIVFHCGFTLRLRVGSRQVEADCDALNLFQRFGASRHRG